MSIENDDALKHREQQRMNECVVLDIRRPFTASVLNATKYIRIPQTI